MPFEEVDLEATEVYFGAIEILEAQEMLRAFTVSDWPNMKKDSRETLHRKLHKVAFPDTYDRTVTPQQLAVMLKTGRI